MSDDPFAPAGSGASTFRALFVAAAAGTAPLATLFCGFGIASNPAAAVAFAASAIGFYLVWLIAAIMIGYPVWVAAHAIGWRSLVAGLLLGMLASMLGHLAFGYVALGLGNPFPGSSYWIDGEAMVIDGVSTTAGRSRDLWSLAALGVLGAVSGLAAGAALWASAYRKCEPA